MKSTNVNLIPDRVNPSPDYYCTWQTQLYATCDGKPEKQREIISEKALFSKEKPFGWAEFYKAARRDLIFVIDDSWDVPPQNNGTYYGSLVLDGEKFPNSTHNAKTNAESLKNLVERIKSLGWKGLGGWICAQESKKIDTELTVSEYWKKRCIEADISGFCYWKVDWGEKASDVDFRKMLTEYAKKYAPNLTVEHAVTYDILPYCDVFRTYDVPAIMSIPMTIKKLEDIFSGNSTDEMGIINCEDEAYIAAAGGFSMGIMRHPYTGCFTNGNADMSFPETGRNIKTKIYEVIRAARWHRAAPAFKSSSVFVQISENTLSDYWDFENKKAEIEEWWFDMPLFADDLNNNTIVKTAAAQIVRNCDFANVEPDENGNIPYIVASKNPNGAFSAATLGRTFGRKYKIPKCSVTIDIGNADTAAVFGEYKNLIIKTEHKNIKSVLMQDIAADTAYDVTEHITFADSGFVIPGEIIHDIGTSAQPGDDTSEPGAAIKIII